MSERNLRAVARVGQAVNLAVERFVTVGETIGDDNAEIKLDMFEVSNLLSDTFYFMFNY